MYRLALIAFVLGIAFGLTPFLISRTSVLSSANPRDEDCGTCLSPASALSHEELNKAGLLDQIEEIYWAEWE